MERLSQDKIRIFLTFDDLSERGIQKEELWREIPKVHELFSEMMDQAYSELGFDPSGPLAVEVFQLPAQGMVVIVTRGKLDLSNYRDDMMEEHEGVSEEVFEMEVEMESNDLISYAFRNFEHLIQAAKRIDDVAPEESTLYNYKDIWILQIETASLEDSQYETLLALLSEYGDVSAVTQAVLQEYGRTIMAKDAVKQLCRYFK